MKLFQIKKGERWISLMILGLKIPVIKRIRLDKYIQKEVLKIANNIFDITQCPKAKGKLRKLQIADTLLLKIFHNICKKHNVQYSLEGGTLLGAIRHKGFIPWDDDLDITILYNDYERLVDILKKELDGTNLILFGVNNSRFGNDTLRISHNEFPQLNLDIFYLHTSSFGYEARESIKKLWEKFRESYYKQYKKIKNNENFKVLKDFRVSLNSLFEKEIKSCNTLDAKTFVHKLSSDFWFISKENFYPLKLTKFEDFEFYIPNNPIGILEDQYEDWTSFPPNISHHGSAFTNFEEDKIDVIITELRNLLEGKFNEK